MRANSNVASYSMPSLDVAPDGSICFAVVEPTSTPNLITSCLGSSIITPLASADHYGIVSLEVGPTGMPLVAYSDASGTLRVHHGSDEAVDSGAAYITAVLKRAPTGVLHLSYLAMTTDGTEVRHAVGNGTTWTAGTIDPSATGNLGCLSLAVDGASRPHVLYSDTSTETLVLADWDAGAAAWRTTTVRVLGAGEADVLACALALDAADVPHIAYAISTPGSGFPAVSSFNYAIFNGADWSTATTTDPPVPPCVAGEPGRTMQMVLDSAGQPHITYTACGTEYVYLQ